MIRPYTKLELATASAGLVLAVGGFFLSSMPVAFAGALVAAVSVTLVVARVLLDELGSGRPR